MVSRRLRRTRRAPEGPASVSAPRSGLPDRRYERFEGTREYEHMFDELLHGTQQVVRIFDRTLSAAYNSPRRCDAFSRILRAGPPNSLQIVIHEPQPVERVCPRFVMLLQRFSHVAKVRQTPRFARHVYDPFVVFDASHYLHRFHHEQPRFARGLNDVDGAQQLLERFDELWDASEPALARSIPGL
jgi:hypothetical protein